MVSFPKYPEFNSSKYPWIGDLPKEWDVRRLKEVGRLFGGTGFPHEYQNVQGEEFYFYKVGDLSLSENGKTLLASPHTVSKDTAQILRANIVPKYAIVYAKIGAALLLNRRRMTTAACCIDNNMTAYVTTPEKVIPEWAFYWLSTIDFGEHVNPGAVPSLSEGYQSVLPMPVPPLDEQQTIARFLDFKTAQIDALIAKKQALLDKLAEKRVALISHAVTKGLDPSVPMKDSGVEWLGEIPAHWELVRLGRKIQLQRGVDITKGEQSDGDIPVVSSGGIASFHNVAYSKGPGVIVGRKGTAGAVYYVDSDYWPHDTTLWVKNFGGNVPRYVFYKLLSMDIASFDTGSANPTINRNLVHPTLVSWPPVHDQKEIARFIDRKVESIEKQSNKVNAAIQLLQEYRSALITNAVTGKIDVRDWQPNRQVA